MQDQVSDSFIIANHLELDSDSEYILDGANLTETALVPPRILSQINELESPVVAGVVEAADGQTIPISIGKTDIGNGKPRPFIHISDDPSIAARHLTLTAMQTNDGKYRVMLRQNHPHTRVLLGGSLIRPCTPYPVADNDEITIGDGVTFRVKLNNMEYYRQPRRSIGAGPTQPYVPSPDSEASHEAEMRNKEEKRRKFQERTTPDDSLLMQIAAATLADEEMVDDTLKQVSLVHEVTDTFPYSSRCSSSSISSSLAQLPGQVEQPPNPIQSQQLPAQSTPLQPTFIEDEVIDHLLFDACSPGVPRFTQENPGQQPSVDPGNQSTQSPPKEAESDESFEAAWRPPQLSQVVEPSDLPPVAEQENESPRRESLIERTKKRLEAKRLLEEATNFSTSNTPGKTPTSAGPPPRKMTRRSSADDNGPKKIVFLRTAVDIDKATESAVVSVGGKIESKWSPKVEALVSNGIVRTTKFMCAINKGLAIFPRSILTDIKTTKSLPRLDDPSLWLSDPSGEAKYEFNLRESIERARAKPLLENYDVFCFKNSIGEFTMDELKDLVTTAGGRMITRLPKSVDEIYTDEKRLIVIGSEANKASAKTSGVTFLNKVEFIVDSCIKQTLNFDFARVDV